MTTENKNVSFRNNFFMLTEWPDALGRFAFFDNMTAAELAASEEGLSEKLTNIARTRFEDILPTDSFVALCMETEKTAFLIFTMLWGSAMRYPQILSGRFFFLRTIKAKNVKFYQRRAKKKKLLSKSKSFGRASDALANIWTKQKVNS